MADASVFVLRKYVESEETSQIQVETCNKNAIHYNLHFVDSILKHLEITVLKLTPLQTIVKQPYRSPSKIKNN